MIKFSAEQTITRTKKSTKCVCIDRFMKTLLIPALPGSCCDPILLERLFFFPIAAVYETQIRSDRLTSNVGWSSHSMEALGFTCLWALRCPVPYSSMWISHRTGLTAPERTVVLSNVSKHPQNKDENGQWRAKMLVTRSWSSTSMKKVNLFLTEVNVLLPRWLRFTIQRRNKTKMVVNITK